MNPDLPAEIRPLFAIFPLSSTCRDTRQSWIRGRGHLLQGSCLPRAAFVLGMRALSKGVGQHGAAGRPVTRPL